ncbi:MAG: hypothetical protein K0S11_36 [Gammaproteobacteria bacterium]|jgi:hypothetical protein|nr:hypothetical protein [Gammaproteobacteria bacterium]
MSISHQELPSLDDSVLTAIIYAKNDLFGFKVEMRYQGDSYFLTETGKETALYASIEQAKRAARDAGAVKAYAAYDTVYDEMGTKVPQQGKTRFDYQTIDLSTYY